MNFSNDFNLYGNEKWDGENQLGNPVVGGVYFYTLKAAAFDGGPETLYISSKLLLLK